MRLLVHLTLAISTLVAAGCATGDMASTFHGKETKISGFTKHFEESLFQISDHGMFSAELLIPGKNLVTGMNDFDIVIHDRNDRDVEAASVDVSLKGGKVTTGKTRVIDRGGGLYGVRGMNVPIPGAYELIIGIESKGIRDNAVFSITAVMPR